MIGDYVKQLRETNGIGSRELSRSINKASAYVSQLERGLIKKPDYDTTKSILEILGVNSEEIESVLQLYKICPNEKSLSQVKKNVLTDDVLETKYRLDAKEVFNFINTLPIRTQELLKEMLNK